MKLKEAGISKVAGGFVVKWRDDSAADEWDAKNRNNMMGGSWYGTRPETDGACIFTTKKQLDQFLKSFLADA